MVAADFGDRPRPCAGADHRCRRRRLRLGRPRAARLRRGERAPASSAIRWPRTPPTSSSPSTPRSASVPNAWSCSGDTEGVSTTSSPTPSCWARPSTAASTSRRCSETRSVTVVRPGPGLRLRGRPGQLVTILPLHGPAVGVRTEGLRYPLDDETLPEGTTRGVSNELVSDDAHVSLARWRGARGATRVPSLPIRLDRRTMRTTMTSRPAVPRRGWLTLLTALAVALALTAAACGSDTPAAQTRRHRGGRTGVQRGHVAPVPRRHDAAGRHPRLVRGERRGAPAVHRPDRGEGGGAAVGRRRHRGEQGDPHQGQPGGRPAVRDRREPAQRRIRGRPLPALRGRRSPDRSRRVPGRRPAPGHPDRSR